MFFSRNDLSEYFLEYIYAFIDILLKLFIYDRKLNQ